ncbi:MAG TPA: hypothetical protein VEA60_01190, partial [Allosphingosinicella sp.]|nr:hypothetical protein [Allosphingosinicella sp.]
MMAEAPPAGATVGSRGLVETCGAFGALVLCVKPTGTGNLVSWENSDSICFPSPSLGLSLAGFPIGSSVGKSESNPPDTSSKTLRDSAFEQLLPDFRQLRSAYLNLRDS